MAEVKKTNLITKGKTKEIRKASDGLVYVCSLDKTAASNKITCNVLELLERAGIKTHYIKMFDATSFLARELYIIPLIFSVRRCATDDYLARNPEIPHGAIFKDFVFEIFEKNGTDHNPMLGFDFKADKLYRYDHEKPLDIGLICKEAISKSRFADMNLDKMSGLAMQCAATFKILEDYWYRLGGTLLYVNMEFGVDVETGETLLGCINNSSWRLQFDGEDKTPTEIARLTDKFDTL